VGSYCSAAFFCGAEVSDGGFAVIPDTGEVVELATRNFGLPGKVSRVGLVLPERMSRGQWFAVGETLKGIEKSIMWWIGDWLNYGERRYGEAYKQALDATDRSYQSLRDAKWVAGQFELSRRRDNLSWSHHREVAPLEVGAQERLLDAAEKNGWTRKKLRVESNLSRSYGDIDNSTSCTVDDLKTLIKNGHRFGTIYADPPWFYDNQGTRAATGNHYLGLTVSELCELPIAKLAADDAHLHLWTTNGFLFECPRLFDAWGFEFRSSFVWIKPQIGIGNYWRNSHEFLLTAIRGDAKRFADKSLKSWLRDDEEDELPKSWLDCDRSKHSAKPEQVRQMIERASPGPRLELFGRSPANGWVVWGNQIDRGLLYRDIPKMTATK
jgi:N6-adenosine-specific RNA methylase IME4